MGPGKGILGHGAGHGAAAKNGHWAGAGSPCVLRERVGISLVPLERPRSGRRARAWGLSGQGQGLGAGQGRRAAAGSVRLELAA